MPRKLLLTSLVLCLMFFGGTPLALAGEEDRETPTMDLIEKLIGEGWRPVAEGVFQRSRGSSAVESIAAGPAPPRQSAEIIRQVLYEEPSY